MREHTNAQKNKHSRIGRTTGHILIMLLEHQPERMKPRELNMPQYTAVYSMTSTTVKIQPETKKRLDRFREYKSESYDEVIAKLIFIAEQSKEDPNLSAETIRAIEQARERVRKGTYVTEEQAIKRLGL